MRFVFKQKKIRELYETERGAEKLPSGVVDAFFEVMAMVEAAPNSQTFHQAKSLHFEKLKGSGEVPPMRSMRLNKQYRLEVQLGKDGDGEFLIVRRISKHYE